MGKRYQQQVASYLLFLRKRRYADLIRPASGSPPPFDWPFIRQAFLECWKEPGFHLFWRQWNPRIAYFTYQFYLLLGGDRRLTLATYGALTLCGVFHSLAAFPFSHWSYIRPAAFLSSGLLTIISRRHQKTLRQKSWPVVLNTVINVGFVLGSVKLGFFVDRLIGGTCN